MISEKIYNQYVDRNDFTGLANYLSRFHFQDSNKQTYLNNAIKTFRSQGRMWQGMMARANDDQRNAIAFINAYNSGRGVYPGLDTPIKNKYSENYNKAIDAIGNSEDKHAYAVSIRFGNKLDKQYGFLGVDWLAKDVEYKDNAFNEFLANSRMTEQGLRKAGVKITQNNGQYTIQVDKKNPMFDKIYANLRNIRGKDGSYRWQLAGVDADGKLIHRNDDNFRESKKSDTNSYDGYYYNPSGKHATQFDGADAYLRQAQEVANQVISPKVDNKQLTLSETVSDVSCYREARLNEMLEKGQIKPEVYSKLMAATKDKINTLLASADLSQYEIWANDITADDKRTRSKIDDSEKRSAYGDIVRNAISTNRLHVAAAMQGNQTGTLLTIDPIQNKDQEKGNNIDDATKEAAVQIFIPNLFNDDSEKLFNRDTKTRALKELANMDMYNYDFSTYDGNKIKLYHDDQGNSSYGLIDKEGNVREMSKEDAASEINKTLIAEDGLDLANQSFYNEDGELRDDIKDKDGNINPEFISYVSKQVSNYALASMSEMYPDAYKSFAPLADYIYKGDSTSDDYKKVSNTINSNFLMSSDVDFINNKRTLLAQYILNNMGIEDNFNII